MSLTKCVHIFVFYLFSFACLPLASVGQEVDFYGYGAGRYSTQQQSIPISLLWTIAGVEATYSKNTLFEGSLVGHFEYDLSSNRPTRAHARYDFPVGNGTASLLAGQYLSPVSFLHPSPRWIRVPRRTPTERGVQVAPVGIAGWYNWKRGIIRASLQSRDGSLVGSLGGTYRSFSLFGSDAGYGAMYRKRLDKKWLNVWVGAVEHTTDRVSFERGAFVKYYLEPIDNTRLYTQIDVHFPGEKVGWFAGVSYRLQKYWFAGVFVDKRADGKVQVKATLQFHVEN